ncbi:MAG: hypothetical protein JKY46_10240 [Robiginitomaculum sp.]|nr:hypothetical protein [Robiginitomaculum sp.]
MKSQVEPLIEDFLVSICFVGEFSLKKELQIIHKISQQLETRFQYWEILFVVPEAISKKLEKSADIIRTIRNFRILLVNNDIGYYQRRMIGATEALGDVTIITSINEVEQTDICALAEKTFSSNKIIIGKRKKRFFEFGLIYPLLRAISSNDVSRSYLKTIALPRSTLNQVLTRSSAALDLRYPPKNTSQTYSTLVFSPLKDKRKSAFLERYRLSVELVMNATDKFLRAYAGFAALVMFSALFYGFYAAVIQILGNPKEGWFSMAAVQSGTVFFIACGMMILSHSMRRLIKNTDQPEAYVLVGEISSLDFFQNANAFNVVHTAQNSEIADGK